MSGRDRGRNYSFAAVLDLHYRNKFDAFLNDRDTQAALTSARAATSGARRLADLKEMLDNGLITPDDYEDKKREILQGL